MAFLTTVYPSPFCITWQRKKGGLKRCGRSDGFYGPVGEQWSRRGRWNKVIIMELAQIMFNKVLMEMELIRLIVNSYPFTNLGRNLHRKECDNNHFPQGIVTLIRTMVRTIALKFLHQNFVLFVCFDFWPNFDIWFNFFICPKLFWPKFFVLTNFRFLNKFRSLTLQITCHHPVYFSHLTHVFGGLVREKLVARICFFLADQGMLCVVTIYLGKVFRTNLLKWYFDTQNGI